MMCVDGETVVVNSRWSVLDDGVGKGVVKASPVGECMGPSVSSHEVLAVYRGGDIRQDRLDVALDRVLPLLIGGGTLMSALVVFVELVGLGGTECCVEVAA